MHFDTKNYLKNNRNHSTKHILKTTLRSTETHMIRFFDFFLKKKP